MDSLLDLLSATRLPFAYDHFAEGEAPIPPFICYRQTSSDNFVADGYVYVPFSQMHLELYTDTKDPDTEKRIERALTFAGIAYSKTESWIEDEGLYEILYQFELQGE